MRRDLYVSKPFEEASPAGAHKEHEWPFLVKNLEGN